MSPSPDNAPVRRELPYSAASPWMTLSEAMLSLHRQLRRTVLAVSGITVGTVAVVALLNIGYGASAESLRAFRSMGTDILMVTLNAADGSLPANIPLSYDFAAALSDIPGLVQVAPVSYDSVTLSTNGPQMPTAILGTTPAFMSMAGVKIIRGRGLSAWDSEGRFAVAGNDVFSASGASSRPLSTGSALSLRGYTFDVIGRAAGQPPSPLLGLDMNRSLIVPVTMMNRITPSATVSRLIVRVQDAGTISAAGAALVRRLSTLFPDTRAELQIPAQLIEGMQKQAATFSWLLGGLGGISLLVGGMGVMNLMLMSVAERRREIGLRMALGARSRDILQLFIAEAGCLSLPGALAGTLAGLVIAYLFSFFSGWDFTLYLPSLPLGMGCALLTGILSGLWPAMKAARLQPIQALRND